jgi:hypothetical protein
MHSRLLVLVCLLGLTAGCAPTLQYSEVSPKYSQFVEKSVVIMPFTNSIGMEAPNDMTNSRFVSALTKTGKFEKIVDPAQVKAYMFQNASALDVITKFRTKWVATGYSDAAATAWIGKAFNADSIIFGEISQWAETTYGSKKIYRAGLNFRWVDAKTGEMLWKGSQTNENSNSVVCLMGCSNVEKTMQNVIDVIISAWPK